MGRGTWAVVVVSGLLALGACGGDDDSDSGGSGNAGQGASSGANGGSGGSTSSGSSGSSGKGGGGTTGTGTGTTAGNGGSAGGNAGSGGGTAGSSEAGSGGSAICNPECQPNQRCALIQVQCVRAPCPPRPTCVDASTNGGSGAAGSGAAGSLSGSGKACGSRGLGQCADSEFCEFPMGADCGRADAPGTCAEQPMICTREFAPVCGCDGMTYSNKCEARAAGVSVETEGACGGMSSSGGTRCVGPVTCPIMPSKCPDLQVHTVENGCYGPCVSIDQCECSGPADCPDENQYTCFMSAMHCGPYV